MHQAIGYIVLRKLQDVGVDTITQTLAMLVTGTLLGWMLTRAVEQPAHKLLMKPFKQGGGAPRTRETKTVGPR
jgi:peptidoglycan/LPS O-acetylase OafA/YrhL